MPGKVLTLLISFIFLSFSFTTARTCSRCPSRVTTRRCRSHATFYMRIYYFINFYQNGLFVYIEKMVIVLWSKTMYFA